MNALKTAVVMVLFVDACALAGEAVPARADARDDSLRVSVVSVSGPAQLLQADGEAAKYVPLRAALELNERSIIRTGFGAKVVLKFADRGEVVVNNATKIGIGEFRKQGQLVRTRLGLKYGTIHAQVERGNGPCDFRVATPVAIAAARGTGGGIGYCADMGMNLAGSSGTWGILSAGGERKVRAGEQSNGNRIAPSELALQKREVQLGDVNGGLSSVELRQLRDNGGGRGVVGFTPGGVADELFRPLVPVLCDRNIIPNDTPTIIGRRRD